MCFKCQLEINMFVLQINFTSPATECEEDDFHRCVVRNLCSGFEWESYVDCV